MMDIKTATIAFTYAFAIGFLGIFWVVMAKMYNNTIDLSKLLNDNDTGKTSLGRFQFLVFTLVIAGLYVVLSIENGQLIDVPNGALGLLGISGGSFLVSKGISASATGTNPTTGSGGNGDGVGSGTGGTGSGGTGGGGAGNNANVSAGGNANANGNQQIGT